LCGVALNNIKELYHSGNPFRFSQNTIVVDEGKFTIVNIEKGFTTVRVERTSTDNTFNSFINGLSEPLEKCLPCPS